MDETLVEITGSTTVFTPIRAAALIRVIPHNLKTTIKIIQKSDVLEGDSETVHLSWVKTLKSTEKGGW